MESRRKIFDMKRQLMTVSLLALFCSGSAYADDWLQFRHDAARSGVSQDILKFPLKEAWTWKSKSRIGQSPLFHAAARKGKLYFTAFDLYTRYLVCADAKTGKMLWRTPLQAEKLTNALAHNAGPSISDSGKVFVYDWRNSIDAAMVKYLTKELQKNWDNMAIVDGNGFLGYPRRWQDIRKVEQDYKQELVPILPFAFNVFTSVVQTYDAEKGTPGFYLPMVLAQVNGVQPIITLLESEDDPRPSPPAYLFRPGIGTEQWIEDHRYLGFPLLQGDLFSATTQTTFAYPIWGITSYTLIPQTDLLLRWLPGETASFERLHHPLPNMDLEISPTAVLGGYPLTQSLKGLIVSDDSTHRFFGMVSTTHEKNWHHDIGNSLGIATATQEVVVAGYGGESAVNGMFAVSMKDGELLWTYPAKVLPPERQEYRLVTGLKSTMVMAENDQGIERTVSVKKDKSSAQTYTLKPLAPRIQLIPVPVRQPTSFKPRAHERNPGIISVGALVIGQVNGEIVALNWETGKPVWKYALEKNQAVRSLIGTPEHLVACISTLPGLERNPVWEKDPKGSKHFLIALTIKKGEMVWMEKVERAGNLIIADKRLYLMNGEVHAFESTEPEEAKGEITLETEEKAP